MLIITLKASEELTEHEWDCKRLERALHNIGSYWLQKYYPYTQDSIMCIGSYLSFKLCRKTSDKNSFATSTNKPEGHSLNLLKNTYSRLFFPKASHARTRFSLATTCDNVAVSIFEVKDNLRKIVDWKFYFNFRFSPCIITVSYFY